MKKFLSALTLCLVLASCTGKNDEIVLFPESDFNIEVDGKDVSIYTLKAGDIVMQVTNFHQTFQSSHWFMANMD